MRSRRAFAALSSSRRRARSGPIWITRAPLLADDPDPAAVRVAYAIGRSVGSAVTRNRLRRRLRAIVAALGPDTLEPGLYLVGAGPSAASTEFAELGDAVQRAAARLS